MAAKHSDDNVRTLERGDIYFFYQPRAEEADPPEFLDKESAEIVLIAASEDISEELGIELKTEDESAASAEIFKNLRLDRSKRPTEPLFEGEWE